MHLVVPGPLDQRTGGYLYDTRVVEGLRDGGWDVVVHSVTGRFPEPDGEARRSVNTALRGIPDGDRVVLDGLAMGGLPDVIASHSRRLSLVALVHHPLADETGLSEEAVERFTVLEREALSHVAGVIVTSPFTARRLGAFGVSEDRVIAVRPGTESAPPSVGPAAGEAPRLICVGTVSPRKGHDVLVQALDRIRDLAWGCVCAGSVSRDSAFANEVLRAVEDRGLQDRILFVGELDEDELESVYQEASLFVLPSFYEGYGMAFAEALARGVPVVGTTGGAIPDTVPPECGVLVAPGNVTELADTLRHLLEDSERRAALSRAARLHAVELPGWDTQARLFGDAVLQLTADV